MMKTLNEAIALRDEIQACNPCLFRNPEAKVVVMQAPGLSRYNWVQVTFDLGTERDFYSRKAWVDFADGKGPLAKIYQPGVLRYHCDIPVEEYGYTQYKLYIHTYNGSFIISDDSPFLQEYWGSFDSIEALSSEEAAQRFAVNPVRLTEVRQGVWKSSGDLCSSPMRDARVAEMMKKETKRSR